MKLLLDEMWPPVLAVQLRRRGHDAVAVTERPDLRGKSDSLIFETARTEGRAIVTENVSDYRILAQEARGRGVEHPSVIFTTNRRFPRHDPRTTGRLVDALDALLSSDSPTCNLEYWLS